MNSSLQIEETRTTGAGKINSSLQVEETKLLEQERLTVHYR